MNDIKIVFPLDIDTLRQGYALMEEVGLYIDLPKVGLEIVHSVGTPAAVAMTKAFGKLPFTDVKLNDIPNTVKKASRALAGHGIAYFNVMASGGRPMIEAAMEGADIGAREAGLERPGVISVTVLTSLNLSHLTELGICPPDLYKLTYEQQQAYIDSMGKEEQQAAVTEIVMRWSEASVRGGIDCVLCSPWEAQKVHECWPEKPLYTPGIRLPDSPPDDQARTMTPGEAVRMGSKFLVIGRPIRNPQGGKTRKQVVEEIRADITIALAA